MSQAVKQHTLRLPPALFDALREHADKTGQAMNQLIVAVLSKWADKQKG